ncbi:MAG: DNA replication and repair protein RecF [Cytophagales bacterium]
MHLKTLILENFKNYNSTKMEFVKGINCVVGPNGSGKTNLLDAIHMLSMTKSAFNYIDQDLIRKDQHYMRLLADLIKEKEEKIEIRLKQKEKKLVFWNDNEYEKLSHHIGKMPLVLISPNDTDIIRQGSEGRRRFFDSMISTIKPDYLKALSEYQKILRQRNALLKQMAEKKSKSFSLLEIYDEQLIPLNQFINRSRSELIKSHEKGFQNFYSILSDKKEKLQWVYESKAGEKDFRDRFKNSLERDLIFQRTNVGIHKDDYEFFIDGKQVKKYASQGQQKSTVLSLKLIQFIVFKNHFNYSPILLLDDIFDKLDSGRMERLMSIISKQDFIQIFVSDAHPERSIEIFNKSNADIRIFEIENGEVNNVR